VNEDEAISVKENSMNKRMDGICAGVEYQYQTHVRSSGENSGSEQPWKLQLPSQGCSRRCEDVQGKDRVDNNLKHKGKICILVCYFLLLSCS